MEQVNLNLIPGGTLPVCHASQYDVGRTIRFNLFEGASVFAFESGDTAEVHIRKPDDTILEASLTVTVAATYVDVVTTEQMTACAGANLGQIEITRGTTVIGTLNFVMEVERDVLSDGVEGESVIKDLAAQVHAATDDRLLEFQDDTGDFIDLRGVTMTVGKYISNFTTGAISSNSMYMLTDYIAIPSDCFAITVNRVIYHPNGVNTYPQSQMVEFYDADKTLIGTQNTTINGNNLNILITNGSCKYMRVNLARYTALPFIRVDRFPLGGVAQDVSQLGISDLNDLPFNGIFALTVASNTIANQPETNFTGMILTLSHRGKANAGACQIAVRHSTKKVYIRDAWGSPLTWSAWRNYTDDAILEAHGIVGTYSGTFTGTQQINTGITLKSGVPYFIRFIKKPDFQVNVYAQGDSSTLERVTYQDTVIFTNAQASDKALMLYNNGGGLGDVQVIVYTMDSISYACTKVPKKYVVAQSAGNGDFTSVTACFLALKDDRDPKIVEIWEGDYDIYQEYIDANVPIYTGENPMTEFYDYCVWVPDNTTVIGKGNVRLLWMPEKADNPITYAQCMTVSPVNIGKNVTIENLEIHCKNGRYCIHNDSYRAPDIAGVRQKYKNIRCYKYESEQDDQNRYFGTNHVIGFGVTRSMHQEYENCTFKNYWNGRAFYGHTNSAFNNSTAINEAMSGNMEVNNCIFDTAGTTCVKLGNTGETQKHVPIFFSNCYFSGQVDAVNEGSGDTLPNAFDLTFLNCGDVSLHIEDTGNLYPPKAYRTNLTLN